jgi:hypothetical protein
MASLGTGRMPFPICVNPRSSAVELNGSGQGNTKVVHRAYAKQALMKLPSLEKYEQKAE